MRSRYLEFESNSHRLLPRNDPGAGCLNNIQKRFSAQLSAQIAPIDAPLKIACSKSSSVFSYTIIWVQILSPISCDRETFTLKHIAHVHCVNTVRSVSIPFSAESLLAIGATNVRLRFHKYSLRGNVTNANTFFANAHYI